MSCQRDWDYSAEFVVIGTGAGGALITRMLSDAGFNVIALEAGPNYDRDPVITSSKNPLVPFRDFSYKYLYSKTGVPNPAIPSPTEPTGRVFQHTTGRLLGGGTSINGEQYVRSTNEYWDRVAALNGPEWSGEAVTTAYQDLENFIGVPGAYNPEYHGVGGRMQIRQAPAHATARAEKFATALTAATGAPRIVDYNDPTTPLGTFTRWSLFQNRDGTRASSSRNFLQPILNKVLIDTTATKVIFNTDHRLPRAIGVEALRNGKCISIGATKEVIISAGIYSSEVLERSGIGSTSRLASLGIHIIHANEFVGENITNHPLMAVLFSANPDDYPGIQPDEFADYDGGGFTERPGLPGRGIEWVAQDVDNAPGLFAVVLLDLDPKSRGNDHIQNKDPLRIAAADLKYFSNPADLDVFIDVFQQQITVLNTALHAIDPAYNLLSPPLEVINDTAALTKFIQENVVFVHHHTGSNRMAPETLGGVVNRHGVVHGVSHLRVGDGSILPIQPDGNTAGPSYIVGYNVAKSIISKYL
jgi:choline dehydrogenase